MFRRGGRTLPSTRRALIVLPIWIACLLWMWGWWINSDRIGYAPLFIPLTCAMLYEFALLPTVYLYFLFKIKFPAKRRAVKNAKVAVISLCVPSKESIDIVEQQLKAMSNITYPHDSWILDEGNSIAIQKLAKKYGVKHFSRKDIAKYNQETAPFKRKTKAGNVNAWLDFTKRRKYEYFVQFDIDHTAKENYLDKTLGHFRDPNVAWVQAPSVYKNQTSWTARGSSEQELVLQGPLQMGFYGHSSTPFIIGSHCTYRTSAIRQIGGFQPTRAEDHLDTVMLANRGYTGVFVPEIIAEGDGPETLETYLGQQFAWAYSMFQVLTQHSPKLIGAMPWRKKWQFLFAQTWYPLWSLSYLVTFLIPVIALVLGREVANMQGNDFVKHFLPLFACSFLVWWAGRPVMQPNNILLTWRGMLLHVVRWPVVLLAVISAALQIKKPYMITPKGDKYLKDVPSVHVYRPFLVLAFISIVAVIFASIKYKERILVSQEVFAFTNASFMISVCLLDINIRLRKARIGISNIRRVWLKPVLASVSVFMLFATSLTSSSVSTNQIANALYQEPNTLSSSGTMYTAEKLTNKQRIALIHNPEIALPRLGIYSPNSEVQSSEPYIRHSFVDWRDYEKLAEQILITERKGNTPLITIEPRGVDDGQALLRDIANGVYDNRLAEIASVIESSNQPVYIRFAHEMELANLYPWAGQSPELYNPAYKHVVDYIRSHGGTQSRWVWSPAGNAGASDYYPGDTYVDVIGTTVLYDKYWYPYEKPNFDFMIEQRKRLLTIGKPVWIAEYGAGAADPVYQNTLITEALSSYQLHGFSALVYLNAADANIMGPDYRLANLSIFGTTFMSKAVKNIEVDQPKNTITTKPDTTPSSMRLEPIKLPFLKSNTL